MVEKSKMASKLDSHSNRYWFWSTTFVPLTFYSPVTNNKPQLERVEREGCRAQGDAKIIASILNVKSVSFVQVFDVFFFFSSLSNFNNEFRYNEEFSNFKERRRSLFFHFNEK